ncbi:phosphatase PAP2 family protein [Burkholderia gladioli]|uniref:PAP2 family protein n=1 Tax=Burkholderia gladioli (strain BSR3) TaxID=999541 RepID=F2LQ80_BURGS|nr:phosphatase PAP2 family protein [Burkholderia gladioli]AEA64583.1 PAP2 family protein [Burkholderia gladioli BSR3]MBW5281175.1 phosphatase PAP2 family protein [Burkholderia gladioli]CAG9193103.1 Membrane-associated phospholipid phosphatase [Burkholderia gladioli]
MYDLPLQLWNWITYFGSAGITLPLAATLAIWLALGYSARLALTWLAVLGVAVAAVGLTKIAFLGWGIGIRAWDFTGFSGHSMLSSSVYPVAMMIAMTRAHPALRAAGVAAGLALGVAVSFSRVVLSAHSPSESITGCVVGALAALSFVLIAWRAEPHRWSVPAVVASLAIVTITLHGIPVPSQRWVTEVALKVSGHERPYVRARWKANPNYRPASRPGAASSSSRSPAFRSI